VSAFVVMASGDEWVSDYVVGPFADDEAADAWLDGLTDFAPGGRGSLFIEIARDLVANGGAGHPSPTVFVVSAARAVSPRQWDEQQSDELAEGTS